MAHYAHLRWPLLMIGYLLVLVTQASQAQDILRSRPVNQHGQQQQPNQGNNLANNPLANIQLPPQLASLTPQQLHQLAQLRELQLQQQAASGHPQPGNNQDNVAPAPIGAELTAPTAQPTSSSNANMESERPDDGSYNEAGTEMEGVSQPGDQPESPASSASPSASSTAATTSGGSPSAASGAAAAAAPTFEVNWNKCPQLEPSESEKNKKTQVITKCLQSAPIPTNLTRENVETHREQIATCALRVEGWFDDQGNYRYDKAETEIRGKKLEPAIEIQVLKFHVACKEEAGKKFPRDQNKLIDQVQFYQACMDYYISIVCEIEVSVDQ